VPGASFAAFPMARKRIIDVAFETLSDQMLRVNSLHELLEGAVVDVTHLVAKDLRFTCLSQLQRFLETRTGDDVTLCVL
jgi:hypothetical protein